MKIFLDSANIPAITKWHDTGILDGVTTNPTHISKEGAAPLEHVRAICNIMVNKDVSIEVTEKDPHAVYEQAKKIAAIATNVVVKIPCDVIYYPVIKKLVSEHIKLNITLVFSLTQGLMMCKLGVKYISPFIGRLEDSGADGVQLVQDLCHMKEMYGYQTQILAASVRSVEHVNEVIRAGADVATVPANILEESVHHVLTDRGIALFDADWQKVGVRQFP